ncbi:MAG: PVC-type heme-binding CxxCH protein [Planctomycetaceae bacterium]
MMSRSICMPVLALTVYCISVGNVCAQAASEQPRSLDSRIKIELFADSPQIVTPTGIDVDAKGRVWAIESNTHFPPEGYKRHPTDRLLVFESATGGGKAKSVTMFTDGLTHAMSVAVRPTGDIFVATRKAIFVFRDDDGDLHPDAARKQIMLLDTPGDYPHNGLAGFAFDAIGFMYFGCGENLGANYKLIGSDGVTLSGGGEGGNIYRCRPDGTQLTHWATGFWNPHASCVDAFGNLFTVDNDPDSRPPCRLLHIVPDGDYGYRFRNGRKGIHPFTAWDGELPGTLPMVAGTGEAPSGIVAYESDGLPDDYRGELLVTSWGDHRIDRFRLEPKGVSYTSQARAIVSGGEDFRPVGIAVAPDGSLFCTDWVLKEYKVHGQGRIWHISPVEQRQRPVVELDKVAGRPLPELNELLKSPRIEVRRAAAEALGTTIEGMELLATTRAQVAAPSRTSREIDWANTRQQAKSLGPLPQLSHDSEFENPRPIRLRNIGLHRPLVTKGLDQISGDDFHDPFVYRTVMLLLAGTWDEKTFIRRCNPDATPHQPTRLMFFLAARRKNPRFVEIVERGLSDPDPTIRKWAVQWVGEEKLAHFRPALEATLAQGAVTAELFEAVLAALEVLDGVTKKSSDEFSGAQYVLAILRDEKRPAALRARALAMLSPSAKELDAKLLEALLATSDRALKLEAVRTLQQSPLAAAGELLDKVAADTALDNELRAEAIVGLAPRARSCGKGGEPRQMLMRLVESSEPSLRIESLRSLRGLAADDPDVASCLTRSAAALAESGAEDTAAEKQLTDQIAMAFGADRGRWPPQLAERVTKRPATTDDWLKATAGEADAAAGRRIFFHSNGAACYRCHTVSGRGERIGPDLSVVARTMNRRKLTESILEPSKEIAPQFVAWTLVTKAGLTHSGLIVSETREGRIQLATSDAKVIDLAADEIDQRVQQKISIMPEKLVEQLTVGEFRDLLAFLETLK